MIHNKIRYSIWKIHSRDIEVGMRKSNSRVAQPDTYFVLILYHKFLLVFRLITETIVDQ